MCNFCAENQNSKLPLRDCKIWAYYDRALFELNSMSDPNFIVLDALLQFSSTSAGVLFVIFNIVKDINAEKRPSLSDRGIFSWGWRPLDSFLHENKSPEMKMTRKWNESHYFGGENHVLMIGSFQSLNLATVKAL